MNDDAREPFEIPKDMRSMAEASFEQARQSFEKFVVSAQAAAGSIEERNDTVRAGARDVSSKTIAYAEQNVQASLATLKPTDILISPELGDFSTGDFDNLPKISPLGEAAAFDPLDPAE